MPSVITISKTHTRRSYRCCTPVIRLATRFWFSKVVCKRDSIAVRVDVEPDAADTQLRLIAPLGFRFLCEAACIAAELGGRPTALLPVALRTVVVVAPEDPVADPSWVVETRGVHSLRAGSEQSTGWGLAPGGGGAPN